MLEVELQSQVIKYLETKGYLVTRFNNKGIRGHKVKRLGISDLLCATPTGRFLALEVKTLTGDVSLAQESFLNDVRQRGGLGWVIRSMEELESAIDYYEKYGLKEI